MVDAATIPAPEQVGPDPAIRPIPAPPADASNHPDDIKAGVPSEASAELLAAIAASHVERPLEMQPATEPVVDPATTESAITAPAAYDPKDALGEDNLPGDTDLAALLAKDDTPAWLRQNIKRERDLRREAVKAQKIAEEQATQFQRDLEAARAASITAPEPEPARPTRDQFDTPENYDAAIDTWTAAKSERAVARAAAEQQRQQQEQVQRDIQQQQFEQISALQRSWTTKRTAAIAAHPDYVEVAEASTVVIQEATAMAIMAADNGGDIAYHLGKNPQEAASIAALPPLHQLIAVGQLSARLAKSSQPEVSRAPEPIDPISGSRATVTRPAREPTMEEIAAAERTRATKERTPMWGGRRA